MRVGIAPGAPRAANAMPAIRCFCLARQGFSYTREHARYVRKRRTPRPPEGETRRCGPKPG